MKNILLIVMAWLFSFNCFSQEICKCYNNDCPSIRPMCIGIKHFVYDNNIWEIDSLSSLAIGADSIFTYSLSKTTSKEYHIPKSRVNGFDPERWRFESQIEEVVRGQDTVISVSETKHSTWYLIMNASQISISTEYVAGDRDSKCDAHLSIDYSKTYGDERMQKCFFITGHRFNEWLVINGKEVLAQDLVDDWTKGTLKKAKK